MGDILSKTSLCSDPQNVAKPVSYSQQFSIFWGSNHGGLLLHRTSLIRVSYLHQVSSFETPNHSGLLRNIAVPSFPKPFQTQSHIYTDFSSFLSSNHGGLLLPEIAVLMVGGDHVGRVPSCDRSGGALHHDQTDGGLGRGWVGSVLLGGVFAAAVVHDAGDQEDQQQHDIAGDEDAQVECDRVDLLVVLQKTHGDIARGAVASGALTPRERRVCYDETF